MEPEDGVTEIEAHGMSEEYLPESHLPDPHEETGSPTTGRHRFRSLLPMKTPAEVREIIKRRSAKRVEDENDIIIPVRPIYKCPVFCASWTLCLLTSAIPLTIIMIAAGVNVIPFEVTVPLEIRSHPSLWRDHAFQRAHKEADLSALAPPDQAERSSPSLFLNFIHVYKGNLIVQDKLEEIRTLANDVASTTGYTDYCYIANSTVGCNPSNSVPLYFDLAGDSTFSDIDNSLDNILNNATYGPKLQTIVDKHFGLYNHNSKYAMQQHYFGLPMTGYQNLYDREDEQIEKVQKFIVDTYFHYVEASNNCKDCDMRVLVEGAGLRAAYLESIMITDFMLVAGALVFILLFMVFQIGSCFLAVSGYIMILLAFPMANLIYRLFVEYFGVFNMLAVFVILGIGADDIFVITDHWKQTAHDPSSKIRESYGLRMNMAYRKAAKAMLITSLTTMVAFISNMSSQLWAVKTFGLFSALLVLVNYIAVITFYPALLILHHKYVGKVEGAIYRVMLQSIKACFKTLCPCCRKKAKTATEEVEEPPASIEMEDTAQNVRSEEYDPEEHEGDDARSSVGSVQDQPITVDGPTDGKPDVSINEPPLFTPNWFEHFRSSHPNQIWRDAHGSIPEKFFKAYYAPWIVRYRYAILVVFTLLVCVSLLWTGNLEAESEPAKFLPDDDNFQMYDNILNDNLSFGNIPFTVTILFGIEGIDRSGTNPTNPKDIGTAIFDETVDLSSTDAQQALYQLCTTGFTEADRENLRIKNDEITCFMEDFKSWLESHSSQGYSFPSNNFSSDLVDWLGNDTAAYLTYAPILAAKYNDAGDTVPAFYGFQANLTLTSYTTFEEGIDVYYEWENWMSRMKSLSWMAPLGTTGFQFTHKPAGGGWHWFFVQRELILSAFVGVLISLFLSFVVLSFFTWNWIIGGFATFSIGVIVVMVLGFISAIGWKLGVQESINIVLVVGMSIDYVVHLAEAYIESPCPKREDKITDALSEVGISVISGAASTSGAAVFMLGAVIIFFLKFAIFILSTILISTLVSLMFFAALCAAFGPTGTQGNMKLVFKRLKRQAKWVYTIVVMWTSLCYRKAKKL